MRLGAWKRVPGPQAVSVLHTTFKACPSADTPHTQTARIQPRNVRDATGYYPQQA